MLRSEQLLDSYVLGRRPGIQRPLPLYFKLKMSFTILFPGVTLPFSSSRGNQRFEADLGSCSRTKKEGQERR